MHCILPIFSCGRRKRASDVGPGPGSHAAATTDLLPGNSAVLCSMRFHCPLRIVPISLLQYAGYTWHSFICIYRLRVLLDALSLPSRDLHVKPPSVYIYSVSAPCLQRVPCSLRVSQPPACSPTFPIERLSVASQSSCDLSCGL